jgi:hypothetical protein
VEWVQLVSWQSDLILLAIGTNGIPLLVHESLTPGIDGSLGAVHDVQFAQDIVDMALP